ncbi:MAG: nitronate monooxygenase [Calditrichaeota bacterium]|nr:nitronate monooxygenase [Calditrichota bacterium]
MKSNRITDLFNIKYPIIQAGMVWCSGYKLASAASNSGCLGLIGAGSMKPDLLDEHLTKIKRVTQHSWGVNLPVFSPYAEEQVEVIIKHKSKIVFTSAGSPKQFTDQLKGHGIVVVHVVPSPELAVKCQSSGVDAVVAEGFEAGGHNGIDEITTMVLIPQVCEAVQVPVIAAGGIATGQQMLAALSLGAEAVQIGSRFAVSKESSAHQKFKEYVTKAGSGDTKLLMKNVMPVRLLKNKFFNEVVDLENRCASKDEMISLLGKGRAKQGILEGNLDDGELEIGQVSALIKSIPSVADIVADLLKQYQLAKSELFDLVH